MTIKHAILTGYQRNPESTAKNPKTVSFRLAATAPLLGGYLSSISVTPGGPRIARLKNDETREAEREWIGFQGSSLIFNMFRNNERITRIDLTSLGDREILTLNLLDTTFTGHMVWDETGLNVARKVLDGMVKAGIPAARPDLYYFHGQPEKGMDLNPIIEKMVSLWEREASPRIAGHGGRMEPKDITFEAVKDERGRVLHWSFGMNLASLGACGGCSQKADTLDKAHAAMQAALGELNKNGQDNPEFRPWVLDRKKMSLEESTGLRVVLKPGVKLPNPS